MSQYPIIRKASGEEQPFNPDKLKHSLHRSGADITTIDEVANDIIHWVQPGTPTKQIYTRAFRLLRKKQHGMAARYGLKKAIMELGPSGYPFEKFIGYLFKCMGFDVQVGEVVNGQCVTHEVDVIATNLKNQHLVECKYHNSQGKFSNVQVPLYIRSRVNDIIETRKNLPEYEDFNFHGWVVTNTRFTSDAINYGKCSGLNLMSWDFPEKKSLKALTEKYRAFPITALTNLTKAHKQFLLKKGVVLCSEILQNKTLLQPLQFSEKKTTKVMEEVRHLCNNL